jgi:hypothetical protein
MKKPPVVEARFTVDAIAMANVPPFWMLCQREHNITMDMEKEVAREVLSISEYGFIEIECNLPVVYNSRDVAFLVAGELMKRHKVNIWVAGSNGELA